MANQLYVRTTITISRAVLLGLARSGRTLVAVDEMGLDALSPEERDALAPYCVEYGPERERDAWAAYSSATLDLTARPSWAAVVEALRAAIVAARVANNARIEARAAAVAEVLATDPVVERMPACVAVASGVEYVHTIEDGGPAAWNTDIRVIAWIDVRRRRRASRRRRPRRRRRSSRLRRRSPAPCSATTGVPAPTL